MSKLRFDEDIFIRQADEKDLAELAHLRWNFSPDEVQSGLHRFEDFQTEFELFFRSALNSGHWQFWIAEHDDRIIANAYLEFVRKVPRPGRKKYWGYITNVYVKPEMRNQRVGHALLEAMIRSAKEASLEFLILWPSKESVNFYRTLGFQSCQEAMELYL